MMASLCHPVDSLTVPFRVPPEMPRPLESFAGLGAVSFPKSLSPQAPRRGALRGGTAFGRPAATEPQAGRRNAEASAYCPIPARAISWSSIGTCFFSSGITSVANSRMFASAMS